MDFNIARSRICITPPLNPNNMSKVVTQAKQSNLLTLAIVDIVKNLAAAEMKTDMLSKEDFIRFKAKECVNMATVRIGKAIDDLMSMLGPESQELLKNEIIQPEVFLQVDQVITAMYAMPKGIRDDIEEYVMGRYNVYAINK